MTKWKKAYLITFYLNIQLNTRTNETIFLFKRICQTNVLNTKFQNKVFKLVFLLCVAKLDGLKYFLGHNECVMRVLEKGDERS